MERGKTKGAKMIEDAISECAKIPPYKPISVKPFSVEERPKVKHYQTGGIEPIDYINSHNFNFNKGNAIKYISRCGKKEGESEVKDLQKAIDYLNFEIRRLNDNAKS
jgi:hypothetical protein